MPLIRDRIIGHDNERLTFRFTMRNDTETVECQISDAAMDELGGVKGTESIARQAQFLALRDAVETIASEVFHKAPHVKGQIVRIFTRHIAKPAAAPPAPIATGAEPDAVSTASLRVMAETRPASPPQ